jgi:putative heme transporter
MELPSGRWSAQPRKESASGGASSEPRAGRLAESSDKAQAENKAQGENKPQGENKAQADEAATARRHRLGRVARAVFTIALLGVGAGFIADRASEFGAGARLLAHIEARWIILAIVCEGASMFVFGWMQRRLLRAGRVLLPVRTMVEITVAANALAATLPGGVAWAAAWEFHQLERRGVSRTLRIWMFLMAGAFSSFALFVLLAVGTELAGSHGPVAGLRVLAAVLAAIPLVALGIYVFRRPHRRGVMATPILESKRLPRLIRETWERVETIHLTPRGTTELLGLGILNWLFDCAVLVACLMALGTPVPWRDILVIYSLTQIAAVLPITPGGIGVVEGSLGALLTAYGVSAEHAVGTVILYRLVSFWGLVPLGWGVWAVLDSQGWLRRLLRRTRPSALEGQGVGSEGPTPESPTLPAPGLCVRDCNPIELDAEPPGQDEQLVPPRGVARESASSNEPS